MSMNSKTNIVCSSKWRRGVMQLLSKPQQGISLDTDDTTLKRAHVCGEAEELEVNLDK